MTDLSKLRIEREPETKEHKRSSAWIPLALIVLAVAVAGYFLWTGPLRPATEVKATTVNAIYPSQAKSLLNASGYVVAQRQADVASKATGKLEQLLVEEGSVVKKGQVIARLESKDVEANLAQARADLQVADASLNEAKANYERRKKLTQEELISKDEFDLSEAQYKRAIANVAAADARVKAAAVAVENTYVRAPFDGTVLTKSADIGEIVAPFGSAGNSKGAVVSMADMSSLQVEADVSESNIERISLGQPCEITLDAFPEKRYRGVVHMIVPTADRAKATVLTKVRFLEQDARVLPEMSAKVAFLTEQLTQDQADAKPKITVDPAAVTRRENLDFVFLIREKRAVQTRVTLGEKVGSLLEITQGVSVGDQVVLNPPPDLNDGAKIKVIS